MIWNWRGQPGVGNRASGLLCGYYHADGIFKTDGTPITTMAELPMSLGAGQAGAVVYPYTGREWADGEGPDDFVPFGRAWTWDVAYGEGGAPVAVFQVQRDQVFGTGWRDDRIYYYYARWTGTEWQRRFIAHGGRGIYSSERDYGGGMTIDPDHPNVVYIASNAASPFDLSTLTDVPLSVDERYEIYRGVTSDGGLTFTWESITVDSLADNLRPIMPENHGNDRTVVWFNGTYSSYTNFNTRVLALLQPAPPGDEFGGVGLTEWFADYGVADRWFGIDFNKTDAFNAPSQGYFRIIGGASDPTENPSSFETTISGYPVTISLPEGGAFEFRGGNGDNTRAIPGGDTSRSERPATPQPRTRGGGARPFTLSCPRGRGTPQVLPA